MSGLPGWEECPACRKYLPKRHMLHRWCDGVSPSPSLLEHQNALMRQLLAMVLARGEMTGEWKQLAMAAVSQR